MKGMILAALLLMQAAGGWEEAAALLTGAATVEDMDEGEMERFAALHEHPLDINAAARGRLASCGLFDVFQVEQICIYRREHGDILSATELGLVPGFTEKQAQALAYFTVFRTSRPPGQREDLAAHNSITVRGAVRSGSGTEGCAGLKYALDIGERAGIRWSTRTTYDDGRIKAGTISAAYYGRRALGKVIAGDFAARFGQGLTQWTGFSMSGYPTIQAFRKNASGLSQTSSFTSALKGAGVQWYFKGLSLTTAAGIGNKTVKPITNLNWTGRRISSGVTFTYDPSKIESRIGADWMAGFKGISFSGEIAAAVNKAGMSPAGITSLVYTPSYGTRIAALARYYSPGFKKDYSGLALAFENRWADVSADMAYRLDKKEAQYKLTAALAGTFGSTVSIQPEARVGFRYRPGDSKPLKTSARASISVRRNNLVMNARCDLQWLKGYAWLWYLEPGYVSDNGTCIKAWIRFSLFRIDNWDDRIYVYERDAPGTFNVPAYYGRGYAVSAVGSAKLNRRHSLHLRVSFISYPWNITKKDPRFEAKVQYTVDI